MSVTILLLRFADGKRIYNPMPKTSSILLKSLAAGLCAAVADFILSYPFFLTHEELGIRASVACWLSLSAFFLAVLLTFIYLTFRK